MSPWLSRIVSWRFLSGVAFTLVMAAVIANTIIGRLIDSRWNKLLRSIRDAGDPALVSDLTQRPIPVDDNAAIHLDRLAPRLLAFEKQFAHAPRSGGDTTGIADSAQLKELVTPFADLVDGLARAARCNGYVSVDDFSARAVTPWMPSNSFRSLARFAQLEMQYRSSQGRLDEAMEVGIDVLKLAQLRESEPGTANSLMTIAASSIAFQSLCDVMAKGPISDPIRSRLDEQLSDLGDPMRLSRSIKSERAMVASNALTLAQLPSSQRTFIRPPTWPMRWSYLGTVESFSTYIEWSQQPWHDIHAKVANTNMLGAGPFADLLLPAMKALFAANLRHQATLRAVGVLNALTRFRDAQGRDPEKLDDLGSRAAEWLDPYTGKPLLLKKLDNGWVVYSVGPNGADDQGDLSSGNDVGLQINFVKP
jgi:hypothetical protein